MIRIVIAFVVFVLSGVPAMTVVCDLVLCAPAPSVAKQSCHQHSTSGYGDRLSTDAHGCAHLALVAPFVAPGSRQLVEVNVAAPLIEASHRLSIAFEPHTREAFPHGPPLRCFHPPITPLRI